MSKIDPLKTIDSPDRPTIERLLLLPAETEQAQPGLYVAHTLADPLPMLVASTANENGAAEGGTHKPKRDPLWPMILIGFAFCLTLLWSAFLVWAQ